MRLSPTFVFLAAAQVAAPWSPVVAEQGLRPIVLEGRTSGPPVGATARHVQVIDRLEIEASGARTLADLLRGRTGIHVSDFFGDGSNAVLDMRGFGSTASSNTLVLVDGRRLNAPTDSSTPFLNSIDLANVERVEVSHGSAGVRYGNQAVGGVVHIITREPAGDVYGVHGGIGSFNTREWGFEAEQQLAKDWSYRLRARRRDSDNYRDHNATRLDNAYLKLGYALDGGRLWVEHTHSDEYLELPGSLFGDEVDADRRQSAVAFANDYQDTRSNASRLGLEHRLDDNWRFLGTLDRRDDDRDFVLSFRSFPIPPFVSTQDRESVTVEMRMEGTFASEQGDVDVRVGVSGESSDYLLRTAFGPQGVDQRIDAVHAQLEWPFSAALRGTVGVRHAAVDNDINNGGVPARQDDDVTVGTLGVDYRPRPSLRLFARIDENYRFATVEEHTNLVFGQPVGLDNQEGVSFELGAELVLGRVDIAIQAFRLHLEDEISFDSTGFFNVNLDDTERRGLSLTLETAPMAGLLVGFSHDYVDGEITGGPFEGNRIPLVAEHRSRLFGEWVHGPWTVFGEAVRVGEQPLGADFANSFPRLDAYTVTNLSARFVTGPWTFTARVNNLLDREYSETGALGLDNTFTTRPAFFPAPERNLWATVSYRFHGT